ncbi:MAG: DUF4080 domain-containing protein [Clostridia bacterium]|nr:DUF4080 domain-containing protein [Clostridia bacterium]
MKTVIVGINSKYIHTMLSVRYLAASLNKSLQSSADSFCVYKEFSVNMNSESVLESLYNENADIYCFSTYIFNVDFVLRVVRSLKKLKPNSVIILGGPEVTYENEQILRENPQIDFISCGEGEVSLPALVNSLGSSPLLSKEKIFTEKICGTAFIYNNMYVSFPFAPPICNLDTLPFPYTDDELSESGNKILYYESSRGCPFGCSYCLSSAETNVRFKTVAKTCEELQRFIENKVRIVKFIDRTFNANKKRAEEIVSYLISKDNGVTSFHFEIAPWLVTEKFIELLASSRPGLFQLEIGIQSTNPETLESINRKISFEKVKEAILKLKIAPVHIHVDLIAGLPHETFEIFGKSFDDVMGLECDCLQLGFLKMLKGTQITHQDEHEYIYEDNSPYQILSNKYISYSELRVLEKIANILDLYLNSGLCKFLTASRLKKLFGVNPFEFYCDFAKWLDKKNFFDVLHSTVSLFEFLCDYLSSRFDPELSESVVAFEYYCFTGSSVFPRWLKTLPSKEECFKVLNNEELLVPLMDVETRKIYESMDKKHWFRKSQFVKFNFDENGEKRSRKVLFLHDKQVFCVFLP